MKEEIVIATIPMIDLIIPDTDLSKNLEELMLCSVVKTAKVKWCISNCSNIHHRVSTQLLSFDLVGTIESKEDLIMFKLIS